MTTLTITAKGQVTLRKDVLQHLGIQPGDTITVEKLPNGRLAVQASRPHEPISAVFDMLKLDGGRSLSIEEMGRIAAEGWASTS